MKILINTPPLNLLDGIAGHYKGLKKHWSLNVRYNTIYKTQKNRFGYIFIPFNVAKFIKQIIFFNPNLIVLNISLKKGYRSKILYYYISSFFKKEVFLFIHGWDIESEYILKKKWVKEILNGCKGIIVLADEFKFKLIKNDISVPIYLSTTKVSNELLIDFDITKRSGKISKFLFVSRVEKGKGIFIALDLYKRLKERLPYISFDIVGDGTAFNQVKEYVIKNKIRDVELYGKLTGQPLIERFKQADFFILLSYSEGIPAALLEAIAFGLPIATRSVGGIPDFFLDGEMGILSNSLDPEYYYKRIIELVKDEEKVKRISEYNYDFAQKYFLASSVAKGIERIFKNGNE